MDKPLSAIPGRGSSAGGGVVGRHRRFGVAGALHGDGGGGSVLGLTLVVAFAAAVVAFAPFGGALAARQVLQGAADAAALAAADTASGRVPGAPCDAAGAVAAALGVTLESCSTAPIAATGSTGTGPAVDVSVSTSVLGISITATARAGPPDRPPEPAGRTAPVTTSDRFPTPVSRQKSSRINAEPAVTRAGAAGPVPRQEDTTASTYR